MQDWGISQVCWGHFYLDGGSMFGIVPRAIWSRLIQPDEENGICMALRSLLLRRTEPGSSGTGRPGGASGGRNVLVDCGIWPAFPQKLRDAVYRVHQPDMHRTLAEQAGIGPGEVTDVVATHLHFDHVGGLAREVEGNLVPTFPEARVHVQRRQLEWACSASVKDRGSYVPKMVELIAGLPGLVVHDGPYDLDEGVRVEVADGHTPGMQIVHATCGGSHFIHAADMVPSSAHVPIPYVMAFDLEPLKTVAEKESLFSAWPGAVYFFMHDPDHPFWMLSRTEKGWQRGARWASRGP
ncbi:MAG: MBL fold metallo-hydrolase [Deltaproteobacteria bacterium]|nr:MBL fold metallo-hydrolase [Deltaproteobacteria bacterium]